MGQRDARSRSAATVCWVPRRGPTSPRTQHRLAPRAHPPHPAGPAPHRPCERGSARPRRCTYGPRPTACRGRPAPSAAPPPPPGPGWPSDPRPGAAPGRPPPPAPPSCRAPSRPGGSTPRDTRTGGLPGGLRRTARTPRGASAAGAATDAPGERAGSGRAGTPRAVTPRLRGTASAGSPYTTACSPRRMTFPGPKASPGRLLTTVRSERARRRARARRGSLAPCPP